jgi:hypothetical protein
VPRRPRSQRRSKKQEGSVIFEKKESTNFGLFGSAFAKPTTTEVTQRKGKSFLVLFFKT